MSLTEGVSRWPLSWPAHWKRTPARERKRAVFGTKEPGQRRRPMTIAGACAQAQAELERMGVNDALVSTNVKTRLDGLPISGAAEPADPGAALYFRMPEGADRVLACDTWDRVADNITAIARHIEAVRAIDRYGVGTLDQAFAGYQALPPKGTFWRTALGFRPDQVVTRAEIDAAFRARARTAHPDVEGGSHDAMAALTVARNEAYAELGP